MAHKSGGAAASPGAGRPAAARERPADTRRTGALISNVALWAIGFLVLVVAVHAATADFGRRLGEYWSGFITLVLFAGVSLYSVRKRFLWISIRVIRIATAIARPLANPLVFIDRLESWRAVHVTVGVIALLPFWWHMQAGLRSPLETILLASVILLVLSGFFGVFVQQYFPHAMSKRAEHEVRFQDVRNRIRDVYVQAEEKILGHQETLIQAYLHEIKPILLGQTPRSTLMWATVRGIDPGERACRTAAAAEKQLAGEAATYRELLALATRKVNLEHNGFNLHLSTGWLTFHIVLSAAVGILVVCHVFAVIYFYGL